MMSRKKLLPAAVAAAALALAPAAQAETTSTSIAVTGGALTFNSKPPTATNFAGVTLNGSTQTVKTALNNWQVNDATGSGAGWNVVMEATQFSSGGLAPKTLPLQSLKLNAPVITANDLLNLATKPTSTGPFTLDQTGGAKVVSAAAGAGQGLWDMSHTVDNTAGGAMSLTIPADASAATYSSTITSTLATGP